MNLHFLNDAQANLNQLIEETASSHQPIEIEGDNHTAILLAKEDWSAIQETLYLLSIPEMRESIKEGLTTPLNECDEELDW
ncbi:type II toxin-antitoxin system Phd/YefM family antitoxin [Dactylococcopsis salina]|uniref:Antitoxin n=1 Tax=Dactylococcopsis salina (strain PCC 8305) TaxID=13035 RepID=K9YX75_DACS8|nr:type II toxin-antitoxin system Phd/YefM family antitoxin [Dactylococcopsis salina]AFZ50683.1 antitoxin of toxin-antitoxin stability system [Dactylococcopsis salina PCC 8305]